MSPKHLPPLEVGSAYEAADFQRFEYSSVARSGEGAILRLHLKNGTTIDLPATRDDMRYLALVLAEAFGEDVVAHLRLRGWV